MERKERDKQQGDQGQDHALPQAERVQQALGRPDLGNVAIHPNGNNGATASEQAFGAQAYAQGSDVHFGAGEHAPGQQDGKQLLGHELSHVVQQNNGKAQE